MGGGGGGRGSNYKKHPSYYEAMSLREPNALRALHVYAVVEEEKSQLGHT